MPFEISFAKALQVANPAIYINECCYGGDVVRDYLLPLISARCSDIRTGQEDWGWFIWFRQGDESLAIAIFCDDREECKFRLRLHSSRRRLWIFSSHEDFPELVPLRESICENLMHWATGVKTEVVP